jgi:hypothetical protein
LCPAAHQSSTWGSAVGRSLQITCISVFRLFGECSRRFRLQLVELVGFRFKSASLGAPSLGPFLLGCLRQHVWILREVVDREVQKKVCLPCKQFDRKRRDTAFLDVSPSSDVFFSNQRLRLRTAPVPQLSQFMVCHKLHPCRPELWLRTIRSSTTTKVTPSICW